MYVDIVAYMYIYIYIQRYIYIYIKIHTCIYVYIYMYLYLYIYIFFIYIYIFILYLYRYVYIYICDEKGLAAAFHCRLTTEPWSHSWGLWDPLHPRNPRHGGPLKDTEQTLKHLHTLPKIVKLVNRSVSSCYALIKHPCASTRP